MPNKQDSKKPASSINKLRELYRAKAKETYEDSSDDIEIDLNATVHTSDDGAFVEACVWVSRDSLDEDADAEAEDIAKELCDLDNASNIPLSKWTHDELVRAAQKGIDLASLVLGK
jgi:hypothetical protein